MSLFVCDRSGGYFVRIAVIVSAAVSPRNARWPDRISYEELIAEMDRAVRTPGVTNAWTMPIKGRIDMLTTGVRTPVGIKVFGADLDEVEARWLQMLQ